MLNYIWWPHGMGGVSAHSMGNICEGTINAERYNICCHPSQTIPAYFSRTMHSHILHVLQLRGFVVKESGTRVACLQSRPVSHWTCVAHYEVQNMTMETPDCWATEVVHEPRMGKNSTYTALTISVLSSYWRLLSVVKRKGDITQW